MASNKLKQGLGSLNAKIDKVVSSDHLIDIEIDLLHHFPDHPFKLYSEEKMQLLQESIENNGILSPIIVMKDASNGSLIIISGHNRVEAAKRIGMHKVPCVMKEVDYETAAIMMVDTNFNQREEILPSEKAYAYKMKLDAMTRKAGRPKKNSSHCATNKRSDEILGETEGESKDTVRRYIRLTELSASLLEKVDQGTLGFIPAVDISYLSKEQQEYVEDVINIAKIKPTKAQANQLKKQSQAGELTKQDIQQILNHQKEKKFRSWKIEAKRFQEYLPPNLQKTITPERADEILDEAMRDWVMKYEE